MTALLYILFGVLGIGIAALLIMLVFLHVAAKCPVDRDEDGEEADERVRQVRDSMRGTL